MLSEAAFGFSEFWKIFNGFAHFMMGDLRAHSPKRSLSVQTFLSKNGITPCPSLRLHWVSPRATSFLFPLMKKVLKGKRFANAEEVKQKMAGVLNASKPTSSKPVLNSGKNVLIGILYHTESNLKVTEV